MILISTQSSGTSLSVSAQTLADIDTLWQPTKMFTIRHATVADMQSIQQVNLANLPENYSLKYILYHAISWPQGSYVAVVTDSAGQEQIVGYVLAKTEDEAGGEEAAAAAEKEKVITAHITSISVVRPWRRLGIAQALLKLCLRSMRENYSAGQVTLHVRQSNQAALCLYRDVFKFEVLEVSKKYYANGEDAYSMRKTLDDSLLDSESGTDTITDLVAKVKAAAA